MSIYYQWFSTAFSRCLTKTIYYDDRCDVAELAKKITYRVWWHACWHLEGIPRCDCLHTSIRYEDNFQVSFHGSGLLYYALSPEWNKRRFWPILSNTATLWITLFAKNAQRRSLFDNIWEWIYPNLFTWLMKNMCNLAYFDTKSYRQNRRINWISLVHWKHRPFLLP